MYNYRKSAIIIIIIICSVQHLNKLVPAACIFIDAIQIHLCIYTEFYKLLMQKRLLYKVHNGGT